MSEAILDKHTAVWSHAQAGANRGAASLSARAIVLASALLLSGAASLVYQVVWQRVLTQEIGVDSISVAIIVGLFMLGLGAGSLAGAKLAAAGDLRSMARLYVVAEVLIGVFGLQAVPLLRLTNHVLGGWLPSGYISDFAIHAIILTPPIVLMGATTPLALELLMDRHDRAGRSTGLLCGANTIGAACGALLAGFVLVELFGLQASSQVAAVANFLAAALILYCSSWWGGPIERSASVAAPARLPIRCGIACAMLGFASLAFEIVVFRRLAFAFESHVYVFPAMLASLLMMMGVGDLIGGLMFGRKRDATARWMMILACASIATLVITTRLPAGQLLGWTESLLGKALLLVPTLTLPMLFLGAIFPAVAGYLSSANGSTGDLSGRILLWYTIGNLLGAVLTSFLLLEQVGAGGVLRICSVVVALAVLLLVGRTVKKRRLTACIGACTLAGIAIPSDVYAVIRSSNQLRETTEGVVTYRDGEAVGGVQVNGTPASEIYRIATDKVLARHDLTRLRAADARFVPRQVLIVGIGPGALVWALTKDPDVQRIVVAELSPAVISFVRTYSDPVIAEALNDPRVEFHIGDGRRYVNEASRRNEQFDLVQLGTFFPDVAGSANLYSVDLMRRIRSLLTPSGYFMTLDCPDIARSGAEAFEGGFLIEGLPNYMFFGARPMRRSTGLVAPSLARRYREITGATHGELPPLVVRSVREDTVSSLPLNSDDRPTLEFRFVAHRMGQAPPSRARLYKLPASQFDVTRIDVREP